MIEGSDDGEIMITRDHVWLMKAVLAMFMERLVQEKALSFMWCIKEI